MLEIKKDEISFDYEVKGRFEFICKYANKVENPYPFLGVLLSKLELSLDRDPLNEDEDNMLLDLI